MKANDSSHIGKNINLDGTTIYKIGSTGAAVCLIQEWLCFHRIRVAIDGEFGLATDLGIRFFQNINQLQVDGEVGPLTQEALVKPLTNALQPIAAQGRSLGALTVAYAIQHSRENPREVGGANRGPWVRLYMGQHEGANWPWCAGFVSYLLKQAAESLGIALPFKTSFSCDQLATEAKRKRLFWSGSAKLDHTEIPPGSLFLLRGKGENDWIHTGIVVKAEPQVMLTVEGNTSGDGSAEGLEVWRHTRKYQNIDFVIF